jgi:hypothetical protein
MSAGLDVPGSPYLPLPALRVDVLHRIELMGPVFIDMGGRLGYSYDASKGVAHDALLGTDTAAFVMAHRIPLRAYGSLGVHLNQAGLPIDVGMLATGGADLAFVQAHSFGKSANLFSAAPSYSAGGFMDVIVTEGIGVGITTEWEGANFTALPQQVLGVSGDMSAFRLALHLSCSF